MRNILFYIFIFLFVLVPFHHAHAAWYNSSWTYRIPITIDNTKVDADLTDFPVYVNLADLSTSFHTNVKSDGGDIRVTESDGVTEVPIDLVFYDSGTDTGELHFKASSLANASDTVFYIYYGNSEASLLAENATYGAQNVWTKYTAVYHLQEAVNTTAGGYKDSTSNNRDGTGVSMALTAPDGKLAGKGQDFDGTADYINTSVALSNFITNSAGTVTAWASSDVTGAAVGNTYQGRWVWSNSTGSGGHAGVAIANISSSDRLWSYNWDGNDDRAGTTYSTATWYHTAWRHAGGTLYNYQNGANQTSVASGNTTDLITVVHIGNGYSFSSTPFWNGKIDELRFANTDLGSAWISTEYNNTSSSSTFYTDGAQETNRSFTLKRPPNNFLGLVARYTFDGADMVSNIADSSGNANHGYLSGQTSTTTAIGKLGQALSFDGVNDYVSESAIDLSGTNAISVSLWMKKASFGGGDDRVLFEVTTNTNNNTTGLFFTAEPSLGGGSTCTAGSQPLMAIAVKGNAGYDAHCYTAPSENEWHHYVALYDKSQAGGSETTLYINGVLQTPTGTANACCSNNTNNFGNDPWYFMSRAGSTLFNDGTLDDVRIYSRALSASEIKQLYNSAQSKVNSSGSTKQVVGSGLVGHWSFNGPYMVSNIADSSGNGNHGYLTNQNPTTTTIGKIGQALQFDGVNDYVSVPDADSLDFGSSDFTLAVWVNPSQTSTSKSVMSHFNDGGGYPGWDFAIHHNAGSGTCNTAGRICFYDGVSWKGTAATVSANEWTHIILSKTGTTGTVYVNGLSVGSLTLESTVSSATSDMRIGRSNDGASPRLFIGKIDEARIYKGKALSVSEAQSLYITGQVMLSQ